MANVIKIKAGSGVPTTSNIVDRELAFNRSNNKLYINDSGTIVDLSGTGGGGSAEEADRVVFNAQAGEALSKGDVIYISGISGNTPIVSKADADDSAKMPAFGLASSSASINTSVEIVTFGTLENFDTSAFSVGDTVFVSTTAGVLTATKPTGESGLIQNIGHIVRSHASIGAIKIAGSGRTAATPNLNQDKIFLGNASNQSVSTALSSIGLSKFSNDLGFGGGANRLITDDGDGTVTTESELTYSGGLLDISGSLYSIIRLNETDVTNNPAWWTVADGGSYSIRLNNTGTYPLSIVTNASNDAVDSITLGYNTSVLGNLTTTAHLQLPYGEINDAGTDLNIVGTNAVTLQSSAGTALTIPNASTNVDINGSLTTEGPDGGAFIGNWAASSSFAVFGTANMAGGEYALLTNGTNTFLGSGNGGATYFRGPGNDSTPQLVNDGTNIYMQNAGNFGIGTTILDAGAKLNVVSGSSAYTAQFSRYDADDGLFLHSEAASTHYNWLITTQDNVDKGFEITPSTGVGNRSFTTPAFVIKADTGRIGIGTNSPTGKLDVEDTTGSLSSTKDVTAEFKRADGTYYPRLQIRHSTSGTNIFHTYSTSASLLTFGNGGTADAMAIDSLGRVLIGDTSVHYTGVDLQVGSTSDGQNGIQIQTSTTGYGYVLFGDGTGADAYRGQISYKHGDDYMNFITSGVEAVRIDSSQDAHFDQDVIAFSTTPSDIRLKENFEKIENGLDVISKLEGHTFNWKKGGDRLSAGFKAQEVEKILPHLVDEKKLPLKSDDDKEYKILRYEEIIPYLVEAIKEQQQQINQLEEKLNG